MIDSRVLLFLSGACLRRAGSYEEAARRLELDRRTVKSRADPELLARLAAI